MRWRWLWVFVPISTGLVTTLVLFLGDSVNPIFYLQIDLRTFLIILGIGLSILLTIILAIFDWIEKLQIETIIRSADDRRRFLQRLDHELKNPLTAILAGLANLSYSDHSEGNTTTLNSVQTQVDRVRRLVSELRKLSELETRDLDLGPIDMTELLEDAFSLAQDMDGNGKRNLGLSIPRAPWPLPDINGDRDLLILAIHNLLENAIKFSEPDDTIEMRAFEDGSNIVIEVADTGPGIPEEDQAHIWEELYRGESARGIPGSGLGLALVRAVVARHNGNISLRSRPGKGTVFTMRLPS